MSLKKVTQSHQESIGKNTLNNNDIKKIKSDVVDRFISILWRREVDLKLTTK